jgi:copper resistance protein B
MSRSPILIAIVAVLAPSVAHAQSHDPATHAAHAADGEGRQTAHGGHDMSAPVTAPATAASDPHVMRRKAAWADPHAGHGAAAADDPHAAHQVPTQDGDPHAGHAAAPSPGQQPREPVPMLTDADRAAAFPELHAGHAHGSTSNSLVRFNRFEAWDAQPGSGQAWEGSAWFGGDVQRLWLRSEGEREHGGTAASDVEVLYGCGISPWWDLVAGVRHDFAPGPSQSWAAFGVQGMAPYKFELSATAYLGEHGHSAFVAEIEYELLLTGRLILQPLLEVDVRGQDDPRRGIGSGLSSAEAGLRLRYEITRRFAPYVGLAHERAFGGTADYRREDGEPVRDTRWVAGVRWWF